MLTTRGIVLFWLVWATTFATVLLLVSPGAGSQDAAEAEILQNHLAAGYELRNPPLYDWLLWGVQQFLGTGLSSYLVVRYGLIACTGILFYFAVLRLTSSGKLAAAFSLSLVLFYWFGWETHNEVSHSLTILVTLLLFWLATIAYLDKRTALRAVIVGLTLGLGVLGKWSFFFVMLGLGTALAFDANGRRVFTDPRSLLVLLAAGLVLLPTFLWLIGTDPTLVHSNVNVVEPGSPISKTLRILWQFISILSVVFLPWILVVLALTLRFRGDKQVMEQDAGLVHLTIRAAVLSGGTLLIILAGAALMGWNLFGISDFAPHYLHPFCLLASLGIVGLIATRVRQEAFARALGAISLVATVSIFVAKLASFYIVMPHATTGHLFPYDRLADGLVAEGLGEAQFVAFSARDAGNLIMYMPNARALSPSRRIEPPPMDSRERPCVLIWGGEYYAPPQPPSLPPRRPRTLNRFGVTPNNNFVQDLYIDWRRPLIGQARRSVWHLLWKDSSVEEACRRFVRAGGVIGMHSLKSN